MPLSYPGLPPAGALIALESVVRHGSFAAAARELGVSQPAISQQVKALEAHLGVELVLRLRPRIAPSSEGLRLADAVRVGLDHVVHAVEAIRHAARPGLLTVAATTSFSSYWLMPRLPDFHARNPDVEVHLHTNDLEIEEVRSDFDVGVVFTDAQWPDHLRTPLFADEVMPVCSPDYLSARPPPEPDDPLRGQVLLHHDFNNPSWMGWMEWLAAAGQPPPANTGTRHFSNYLLLLQAAQNGQGVALGWRRLVQPMLDRGDLIRLLPVSVVPRARYHAVMPPTREPGIAALAFHDWLVEATAADW